jgi:hypothetical protein
VSRKMKCSAEFLESLILIKKLPRLGCEPGIWLFPLIFSSLYRRFLPNSLILCNVSQNTEIECNFRLSLGKKLRLLFGKLWPLLNKNCNFLGTKMLQLFFCHDLPLKCTKLLLLLIIIYYNKTLIPPI